MALASARQERSAPDPRTVVTPLNADLVETELLRLGLLPQWQAVVDGIRTGFDVGVSSPTKTTLVRNHASAELVCSPSRSGTTCTYAVYRTPSL